MGGHDSFVGEVNSCLWVDAHELTTVMWVDVICGCRQTHLTHFLCGWVDCLYVGMIVCMCGWDRLFVCGWG